MKEYKGFILEKATRKDIIIYDSNWNVIDTRAYCKKCFPMTYKEAKYIIDTYLTK